MRILLIEDDATLRECLQASLEHHGHQVIAVGTMAAAADALRSEIDAVISDGRFPGFNNRDWDNWGMEIMRSARGFGLPAVLYSGDDDLVTEARRQGFCAFVKPVPVEALLDALESQREALCRST